MPESGHSCNENLQTAIFYESGVSYSIQQVTIQDPLT